MKKISKAFALANIIATFFLSSCQEKVLETPKPELEVGQPVSIEALTQFLSVNTGAKMSEISYNATDKSFVIQRDILISRSEAENYYKTSQEDKTAHRRNLFIVSDTYAPNIKVYIGGSVSDEWAAIVRNAIVQWNRMPLNKINFSETDDDIVANVQVSAANDPDDDAVARTDVPWSSGKPGSSLTINTRYDGITSGQKLMSIAHELGHSIGLMHTNQAFYSNEVFIPGSPSYDPKSVMNSFAQEWTGFTSGDIIAVRTLYPTPDAYQIAGAASDISSGSDGSLYIIGRDANVGGYGVYRSSGWGTWDRLGAAAVRIAVAGQNVPWVVKSNGNIFKRTGNYWQQMPGTAREIAGGGDGSVYIIGKNAVSGGYGIYRWNGTGWTQLVGGGVQIAAGTNGVPWMINNSGDIFKLAGSRWLKMPGSARDIATGNDGTIYMIDRTSVSGGYGIHQWNGVNWSRLNRGAIAISVNGGLLYSVTSSGSIFRN